MEQVQEENSFKQYINTQIEKETGLRLAVYEDLEEYNTLEEAISYLNDVSKYGGGSGCISGLTYYTDTIKFYDEHETEIEEILDNYRDNIGLKTRPEAINSLNGSAESIDEEKNLLSWMAYEETAREILEELEDLDLSE